MSSNISKISFQELQYLKNKEEYILCSFFYSLSAPNVALIHLRNDMLGSNNTQNQKKPAFENFKSQLVIYHISVTTELQD